MVEPDTSEGERMGDQQSGHPQPDAWLVPRRIVDSDGREWGDTVEAQRFPLKTNLEYAEALYLAETNQEIVDRKVEDLHDKIRDVDRDVPYPVYEAVEEFKEELKEVFQSDDQ